MLQFHIRQGDRKYQCEESEESNDEEQEVSDQKEMKEIEMEGQLDENEEQLTKYEEENNPTVEQEEQKDQQMPKNWCQKNHPSDQIIGDKDVGIGTRRRLSRRNEQVHFSLLSRTEPRNFTEACTDEKWVKAME